MPALLDLPRTFPGGDPDGVRATARALAQRGETFHDVTTALRAQISALGTPDWCGDAAYQARTRLVQNMVVLQSWAQRCTRAAAALLAYATDMVEATTIRARADHGHNEALGRQRAADLAHPERVVEQAMTWGAGSSPYLTDPDALALARTAERLAVSAQEHADQAVRRLLARLEDLTGRTIKHRGLSPRLLIDLAGMAPVVGEPIDLANGLVYLAQGQWQDGLLSLGAVIPIIGAGATGTRVGKAVAKPGDEVAGSSDEVVEKSGDVDAGEKGWDHNLPAAIDRGAAITSDWTEIRRKMLEDHGIGARLASERLHVLKRDNGLGGAENVVFDLSGNVFDPRSGEMLGSLTKGGARRVR